MSENVLVEEQWVGITIPSPELEPPRKNDVLRCTDGPIRFDRGVLESVEYRYSVTELNIRVDRDSEVIYSISSEMSGDIALERLESTSVDWTRLSSYDVVRFDLTVPGAASSTVMFRNGASGSYTWFDAYGTTYTDVGVLSAAYSNTPLLSATMTGVADD